MRTLAQYAFNILVDGFRWVGVVHDMSLVKIVLVYSNHQNEVQSLLPGLGTQGVEHLHHLLIILRIDAETIGYIVTVEIQQVWFL